MKDQTFFLCASDRLCLMVKQDRQLKESIGQCKCVCVNMNTKYESLVVCYEIVSVYNSEKEWVFHGVEIRVRSMIVFVMDDRCNKKASNKQKKVTM